MNKAFLFDMDGVLVDSERLWIAEEPRLMIETFGKDIAERIGRTIGVNVNDIYTQAVSHGAKITKAEYLQKFDGVARSIYARAQLVHGAHELITYLLSRGYKIGLVSATQLSGIEQVLRQLPFRDTFEVIISTNDTPGLRSKPAPDGFLLALEKLGADGTKSFVLEDSNKGIAAGKASGCFVIGYRGHLAPDYEQTGADAYAETMTDVIAILEDSATQR